MLRPVRQGSVPPDPVVLRLGFGANDRVPIRIVAPPVTDVSLRTLPKILPQIRGHRDELAAQQQVTGGPRSQHHGDRGGRETQVDERTPPAEPTGQCGQPDQRETEQQGAADQAAQPPERTGQHCSTSGRPTDHREQSGDQ